MAMTTAQQTFIQNASATIMAGLVQAQGQNQYNFEDLAARAVAGANALWQALQQTDGTNTNDPAVDNAESTT